MNKKIITCLLLSTLFFHSIAASIPVKQVLANALEPYVSANEPGCALAYGNTSEEIFYSKGVLETGTHNAINSNTPFLTASTSKHFTAHLAILLASQKQLSLDDLVQQHFPKINSDKNITILDLMNHSSGIPDHWSIFELQGRVLTEKYTQRDALTLLENNLTLQFKPGEQYKYSNGGYIALTQVIENISKQKLNKLFNSEINSSLNINAHYVDSPKRLPKIFAIGHIQSKSGFKPYTGESYIYGDGNIMINAADFSKWAKYLNRQLVSMPEYTKAFSNSAMHNNYFAGLYIESDNNGKQFLQHGGYYENYTQSIVLIPESQEYAIALCNRADFRPSEVLYNFLSEIAALNLEDIQQLEVTKQQQTLKPSLYINAEKNDIAMLISEGDELYYYGQLVSSAKLLNVFEENIWKAKLSTSEIAIKVIDDKKIHVSNKQNTYTYLRMNTQSTLPVKAIPEQTYANSNIGKIQFSFAKNGRLNLTHSVGEVLLRCSLEKLCWSEEGYIIVRIVSPEEIIISTNDLKNMSFVKQKN